MVFTAVFLQSGLFSESHKKQNNRVTRGIFSRMECMEQIICKECNRKQSKSLVKLQNSAKDSKATILSQDKLHKRRAQVGMGFPAALADS